jgi:hypothetical protein
MGFLAARRELLAAETNRRMAELLHGDTCWLEGAPTPVPASVTISGGITSEDEEELLGTLNDWVESLGLLSLAAGSGRAVPRLYAVTTDMHVGRSTTLPSTPAHHAG